ncbi:MAG TPA: hypothetical protein VF981_04845 [Gemmatimonadaceae bacterium]
MLSLAVVIGLASACHGEQVAGPTIPQHPDLYGGDCEYPGGWCTEEYDRLLNIILGYSGGPQCALMSDVLMELLEGGKIVKYSDLNSENVAETDVDETKPFGFERALVKKCVNERQAARRVSRVGVMLRTPS